MGAKNVKIRLERAVDCEDVKSVEEILQKYPDVLEQAFHDDGVFNIGTRAAWRGDLPMLKMFHTKGGSLNCPCKELFYLSTKYYVLKSFRVILCFFLLLV